MNSRLYVGNISFNVTDDNLNDLFAAHGVVVETKVMMDRDTGRSRGFAFVTMQEASEAEAAIAALDGTDLDGRALTVNLARPKEERSGSGMGGNRERRGGGRGRW
jgi:RNA recognition motif-containing protein